LNLEAYALPENHTLEQIDLVEAEPQGEFGVNTVFHSGEAPPNESADYTTRAAVRKEFSSCMDITY